MVLKRPDFQWSLSSSFPHSLLHMTPMPICIRIEADGTSSGSQGEPHLRWLQRPQAQTCHWPYGWCLSPWIKCIFSQKVTGLGHTSLATYWLAGILVDLLFCWVWLRLAKTFKSLLEVLQGRTGADMGNTITETSSALRIIYIWIVLTLKYVWEFKQFW